ncbi:TPA: hypothetical protein ACGU4W_001093 [Vibrio vulnificus]|nr:hypothetical protein [Vibrio vulnificus]
MTTFTQTSIEQIVDIYSEAFKPYDTTTLENATRNRLKTWATTGTTQVVAHDNAVNLVEQINSQISEHGVVTPFVTIKRRINIVKWYQLIAELIRDGFTVCEDHNKYYNYRDTECVCLVRPDKYLTVNESLINDVVNKAVEIKRDDYMREYFSVDAVSAYVEDYQAKEREKFYQTQQNVIESSIAQRLQLQEQKQAVKIKFLELVDGKTEVSFNDLKASLDGADNALVSSLLTESGFIKSKNSEGKAVWVKQD